MVVPVEVVVVAVEAVAVVEVVVVVVGDKEAVCWLIELLPKEIFFGEKKQIKVGEYYYDWMSEK